MWGGGNPKTRSWCLAAPTVTRWVQVDHQVATKWPPRSCPCHQASSVPGRASGQLSFSVQPQWQRSLWGKFCWDSAGFVYQQAKPSPTAPHVRPTAPCEVTLLTSEVRSWFKLFCNKESAPEVSFSVTCSRWGKAADNSSAMGFPLFRHYVF